MHVFRGLPSPRLRVPSAIAIGNFDGVHTGHQALLAGLVEAARSRGLVPSVLTFEPHPREYFPHLDPVPRISTLADKVKHLLECGVERIYMLPFNGRIANEGAEAFVRRVLVEGLDCRWVTVGEDFRFGSGRSASAHDLARFGETWRYETWISPLLFHGEKKVSSTRVRQALEAGDFYEASLMLGRPYTMTGRVIHGAELGRTLGYPTLNLSPIPPGSRARPALAGVFAVKVEGLSSAPLSGVASLGLRPTVSSARRWLLETHVFDWKGDAYGRTVTVRFVERIRMEKKFSGLEELQAAIRNDAVRARQILGLPPGTF
ncbi:bifunctional riboflavin kinase/FAD synthetase [Sutterella sp.]|uniref:bifunctional riboflavin kinase/FAD synthetase n=1 Tax=Sutterella sp. TaxID=1981025 RepID=UPI0026DF9EC0|nr:bifunctional riboflavin kinase/FAD synthetase [Sutterella sp.]MDO5532077.1 bifunctional riboflavin kinase/FAD synthetase [Sutterella sp.]